MAKTKAKLSPATIVEVRNFVADCLYGEYGKSEKAILREAGKLVKPGLTPEQWQQALALLVQYLPMLITLLG